MGIVALRTNGRPNQALQRGGKRTVQFKKGDIIFAEGESSRAMYLLKRGMVRIFKKRGDEANIELETIHADQILGELAFLDGNPRSATAEALTDCEAIEISAETFTQTLNTFPDWLKILLNTVVGRLRTASTRIRQLAAVSTAYSTKDGKRVAQYAYLTPNEVLRISAAILLTATRYGTKEEAGITVRIGLLQRFGNQIMNVPVAKITSFLDLLATRGVMSISDGASEIHLKDPDFLDQFVAFYNEQNLLEGSKRQDVSLKSFVVMAVIHKHLDRYKADPVTKKAKINIAEIKRIETGQIGKEPFKYEDFTELEKLGYTDQVTIKSTDEAFVGVDPVEFKNRFRLQSVVKAIEAMNDQKDPSARKH